MILGGDWDLEVEPILSGKWGGYAGFQTMYELFVDYKPIEETRQYQNMEKELFTRHETVEHRFRTVEEIVQYLEGFRNIFNEIKENGYKSQHELEKPYSLNEIWVNIGRAGEVIWAGNGSHRLAIAIILGIESVPVRVQVVHRLWAERCFNGGKCGVLEEINRGLGDIGSPLR